MNRTMVLTSILVCFALPACSGSGSSTPESTTGNTTITTAASKAATADLLFEGDASIAGAGTNAQVLCNYPRVDGPPLIRMQVISANSDVSIAVSVDDSKVVLVAASGSGSEFTSRTFEGTGMTGFDAALGVQIDASVVEALTADSKPGTIGAITKITGTIDCGDQSTGTSTVVFSGDTLEGAINAGLSQFRVDCTTSRLDETFNLLGIIPVGGVNAFVFASFQFYKQNDALSFDASATINLYESFEGPPLVEHQYTVTGIDAIILTDAGAHVMADLVEQSPADGTAHTLHVEGDLTCGLTDSF